MPPAEAGSSLEASTQRGAEAPLYLIRVPNSARNVPDAEHEAVPIGAALAVTIVACCCRG